MSHPVTNFSTSAVKNDQLLLRLHNFHATTDGHSTILAKNVNTDISHDGEDYALNIYVRQNIRVRIEIE